MIAPPSIQVKWQLHHKIEDMYPSRSLEDNEVCGSEEVLIQELFAIFANNIEDKSKK